MPNTTLIVTHKHIGSLGNQKKKGKTSREPKHLCEQQVFFSQLAQTLPHKEREFALSSYENEHVETCLLRLVVTLSTCFGCEADFVVVFVFFKIKTTFLKFLTSIEVF